MIVGVRRLRRGSDRHVPVPRSLLAVQLVSRRSCSDPTSRVERHRARRASSRPTCTSSSRCRCTSTAVVAVQRQRRLVRLLQVHRVGRRCHRRCSSSSPAIVAVTLHTARSAVRASAGLPTPSCSDPDTPALIRHRARAARPRRAHCLALVVRQRRSSSFSVSVAWFAFCRFTGWPSPVTVDDSSCPRLRRRQPHVPVAAVRGQLCSRRPGTPSLAALNVTTPVPLPPTWSVSRRVPYVSGVRRRSASASPASAFCTVSPRPSPSCS